jgi:hypothetical protein
MNMAQIGISGNAGETLLNIFPNPCRGETFFYTDDLEAAWVCLYDYAGNLQDKWVIVPGRTLHVNIQLPQGTYHLVLRDHYQNPLGMAKPLFVSEAH